jgi:O-succinylbenzoic acid--CoA ligase
LKLDARMTSNDSLRYELPSGWLPRAVEEHGQRPALVSSSGVLSYAELHDRVACLTEAMADRGLEPGSPFAVISERAERIAFALYLAVYTGSALWPIDPRREDLRAGLRDAGTIPAVIDDGMVMPEGIRCLSSKLLERSWYGKQVQPRSSSSSRVQLVVTTSGSSGAPRGVMLTAGNLGAAVAGSRRRLGLQAGDVWLACLPLYHVAGLSILLRCLEAGASVVLQERFDAGRVWSALKAHAVTHLSLVPPMLEALVVGEPGKVPPPSLRVVLLGGGPIDQDLVRRARDAGWPVCPSYGLSENASQVATRCRVPPDWVAGDVGLPLDGVHVEIVDESGTPTSGQGRIRISGPTVMAGYLNPSWTPGDGLVEGGLTTSDLGYLDERGYLRVLGRSDDVIVSGGENVIPWQVEGMIRSCDGIVDVAVVSVPDARWGQRVVAVFTGTLDEAGLERWCRDHVPSPLRPRGYLKLDDLPRNAMGKQDRKALQRRAQDALNG